MKVVFKTLLILSALNGLAAAAGCGDDAVPKHDVKITWKVAGNPLCKALTTVGQNEVVLTFDKIQVNVFEKEGDTDTIQTADVPCGDLAYTILDLEEGDYWVELGAMAKQTDDTAPRAYYQAKGALVSPGEDAGTAFDFQKGTGAIKFFWSFDNGKMCAQNGITTIKLSVVEEPVDCNLGEFLVEGVTWDSYKINAEARDANDLKLFYGEYDADPSTPTAVDSLEVRPGAAYEVTIKFK